MNDELARQVRQLAREEAQKVEALRTRADELALEHRVLEAVRRREALPEHNDLHLFGSSDWVPALTIEEADGSPTARIYKLKVSNGTLTINGDGSATITNTGGGSGDVATDAIWDAKGDLAAGTGADTAAKLTVGADDTILMADAAAATGLKWVASATPSTQAFGDSAAAGTGDTFTRGDHKHAMPANPTTGKFTWVVIARWVIDGLLRADTSNAQGGVWPIPNFTTAGVLVEGTSIFGGLAVTSAGAAVTFDIKHSDTYEGTRTSIFSAVPSIAIGDVHTGDGSSNDGTIDLTPTDYTAVDGGFYWLYITQVGSTAGSEGKDLTVTVTAKVMLE